MHYRQIPARIAAGAIAIVLAGSVAVAGGPDKKGRVSGEEIWKIYAGKTWVWSKGGSYWSGDGSFQAFWENSVGVGKWYVTSKGSLCYEATWKGAPDDDAAEVKRCWKHVRDSKGRLWKTNPQTGEWYRAENEHKEKIKSGNKIKSSVRKLRKRNKL